MIELLHTLSTTLAASSLPQFGIVTDTSGVRTVTSSTVSSFLGGTELFDSGGNVSNHIKQVLFADSDVSGNNSLDSVMSGVDVGNDTATVMSFNRNETVVKEFIFDRTEVRIIFITLYSLVFFCCFFGEYSFYC